MRDNVLAPKDAGYDDARLIWNGMFDKKPALIVRCRGTADVIAAVNFARDNGLLTAVRVRRPQLGGQRLVRRRHADRPVGDECGARRSRDAARPGRRVAPPGGDFDREAQVHGLATPGGVVSATGVGGPDAGRRPRLAARQVTASASTI